MHVDPELDRWRTQWLQHSAPRLADLKSRVARETRFMKLAILAAVVVTVVIGGGALVPAVNVGRPSDVVLAAGVWWWILVAWAGSLWTTRGTWRPLVETTAAFLDLSIRRCEGTLKAVPLAAALYAGELAFIALWTLQQPGRRFSTFAASWPVILLVWIGAPALFTFLIWYRRRKRAELEYLRALQCELSAVP